MAECLKYERQRIGGDWVVAQAVPSRNMREVIRKVLGNDLIFIILRLLELIFLNSIDRTRFLIGLCFFRLISKRLKSKCETFFFFTFFVDVTTLKKGERT